MKMAALICETAAEDRGTAVLVIPSAVSPPLLNLKLAIEELRREFCGKITIKTGGCLPAQRVIKDLPSLGVAHKHERGAGALRGVSVHGADNSRYTLLDRVRIADASTRGLASTGRVNDGLRGRARVSPCDQVDDGPGGAETLRHGRLAGTEDVDAGAGLALLDLGDGVTGGEKGLGGYDGEGVGLHCNESGIEKLCGASGQGARGLSLVGMFEMCRSWRSTAR